MDRPSRPDKRMFGHTFLPEARTVGAGGFRLRWIVCRRTLTAGAAGACGAKVWIEGTKAIGQARVGWVCICIGICLCRWMEYGGRR